MSGSVSRRKYHVVRELYCVLSTVTNRAYNDGPVCFVPINSVKKTRIIFNKLKTKQITHCHYNHIFKLQINTILSNNGILYRVRFTFRFFGTIPLSVFRWKNSDTDDNHTDDMSYWRDMSLTFHVIWFCIIYNKKFNFYTNIGFTFPQNN